MITFALFGAGRIGAVHAGNLARLDDGRLRYVVDVNRPAAEKIAEPHGARVCDIGEAFADPAVDAVIIASPTNTHARLITLAAEAGKAIFCEKPVDLSLASVDACIATAQQAGVPLFVGFNRRFDPSFAALHARLAAGEIGGVEQVIITSRDPAPPPLEYLRSSGGQFCDMTIHDFDMARWLFGEEPIEIFATASCLVDPAIAGVNDSDSAMVVMKTASGRLAHINNSRRATYGYDQRIEVHGARGRLIAGNVAPTTVELADGHSVSRDKPMYFFLERYAAAYAAELRAFIDAIVQRRPMPVGAEDGRRALLLALAAAESTRTGRAVRIE